MKYIAVAHDQDYGSLIVLSDYAFDTINEAKEAIRSNELCSSISYVYKIYEISKVLEIDVETTCTVKIKDKNA